MAQHRTWNPKTFFRRLSPTVVRLYERSRGLTLARDPWVLPSEQTYRAWMALPEGERARLQTELLPVNDLCTSHARPYLEQLAELTWSEDRPELLDDLPEWTVYDLALRLYLADADGFADCHQSYAVDMMSNYREYRGRWKVEVEATPERKAAMKDAMAAFLNGSNGKRQCLVEDYQTEDKLALFVYFEDEMTAFDRFDTTGVVLPVWQRPAVKVAAVFFPESSTLLVKAPRAPERERLTRLFAEIFVGREDYFEPLAMRPKYDFTVLGQRSFDFATQTGDHIDAVNVTELQLYSDHESIRSTRFAFEPGLTLAEVDDALLDHGVVLRGPLVHGAKLQFTFAGMGRSRLRTASITNPNRINLADTPRDRVIRRYLREWGLDGTRSTFAGGRAAWSTAGQPPSMGLAG